MLKLLIATLAVFAAAMLYGWLGLVATAAMFFAWSYYAERRSDERV